MVTLFFIVLYFYVSFFVFIRAKQSGYGGIALVAIFSRFCLCIISFYFALPFSGDDAVKFERLAWLWSQDEISDILVNIDVSRSYLISSITALFYHFMERNIAIPVFINAILGVLIFHYAMILSRRVWPDKDMSGVFALILAIHPTLNINSAVVLRENYIILFVVLASLYLVKFIRSGSALSAILFLFFVMISSFFHGGMILYALGLPLFLIFSTDKFRFSTKAIYAVVFALVFSIVLNSFGFGKISDVQQGKIDVDYLAELEEQRVEANTAYLRGMAPSNVYDVVWQAPIRTLFLLTKPFPWDVSSIGHGIVFIDALVWWFILFLIFRNWSVIRSNPAALALLLACSLSLVAFAYGTGNFGTGVRHRTKFLIVIFVLIYPFLPSFKWREPRQILRNE